MGYKTTTENKQRNQESSQAESNCEGGSERGSVREGRCLPGAAEPQGDCDHNKSEEVTNSVKSKSHSRVVESHGSPFVSFWHMHLRCVLPGPGKGVTLSQYMIPKEGNQFME